MAFVAMASLHNIDCNISTYNGLSVKCTNRFVSCGPRGALGEEGERSYLERMLKGGCYLVVEWLCKSRCCRWIIHVSTRVRPVGQALLSFILIAL